MATYGASIKWTQLNGDQTTASVDGCESMLQAELKAIEFAKRLGWTPPRWWQVWRWNDTWLRGSVPSWMEQKDHGH